MNSIKQQDSLAEAFTRGFSGLKGCVQEIVANFGPEILSYDVAAWDLWLPKGVEQELTVKKQVRIGREKYTQMKYHMPLEPGALDKFLKGMPEGLHGRVILSASRKLSYFPEEERLAAMRNVLNEIQGSKLLLASKMKLIGRLATEMHNLEYGEGEAFTPCLTTLMGVILTEPPKDEKEKALLGVAMDKLLGLGFNGPVLELMDLVNEQAEVLVNNGHSDAAIQLQKYLIWHMHDLQELGETEDVGDLLSAVLTDVGYTVTEGDACDASIGDLFSSICQLLDEVWEFELDEDAEEAFGELLPSVIGTDTLLKAARLVGRFKSGDLLEALLSHGAGKVDFSKTTFSANQLPRMLLHFASIHDHMDRVTKLQAFLSRCEDVQTDDVCDAAFFQVFREVVHGDLELKRPVIEERLAHLRSPEWMASNSREVVLKTLQDALRDQWTTAHLGTEGWGPPEMLRHKTGRDKDSQ